LTLKPKKRLPEFAECDICGERFTLSPQIENIMFMHTMREHPEYLFLELAKNFMKALRGE